MIVLVFLSGLAAFSGVAVGVPVYSSSVYVHRGGSYPVQYVKYNPSALGARQYARLTAVPDSSVVQYSGLAPCVSPCAVESALAPLQPTNAKIVTYAAPAPQVAIVPRMNNDQNAYEYSYSVYDENTGDQKAQHELSDGTVVRGQYSLIQPDGYVREVQYVADDASGFNAVVKNFLPKTETDKAELVEEKHDSHEIGEPCSKDSPNEHKDIEVVEPVKTEVEPVPTVEEKPKETKEPGERENMEPKAVSESIEVTTVPEPVPEKEAPTEVKHEDPCPLAHIETNVKEEVPVIVTPKRAANTPLTYILLPSMSNVNPPC